MEEVDKIIIHSLRDIGCDISNDVSCLDLFSTELVIEAAARCLEIISPGSDIPRTLPINMAARFQVGASIAAACKELGYTGEVGYQTFLYSNVTDLRRVFIFLIEKLPRESDKAAEPQPDDPLSRLKADISRSVRASLNSRLTLKDVRTSPFISLPLETGIVIPRDKLHLPRQEWTDYCTNSLVFLSEQVPSQYLLPSTIVLNARGCVARSLGKISSKASTPEDSPSRLPVPTPRVPKRSTTWLGQQEKILFERDTPVPQSGSRDKLVIPENNSAEGDVEKEEKQRLELEALRCRIDELQAAIRNDTSELVKVKEDYEIVEEELKGRVKEYEALCKALELLPNYEATISKMEELIGVSEKRFESLNAQWETYKKPLLGRYKEIKSKTDSLTDENERHGETASVLLYKLDHVSKQIRAKQVTMQQLQKEYDQLPQNIIRSSYTRRIMEIIGNIKKQKDEIDKILQDTKELQRKTNVLFGTLDRVFTVVDETIFRNAKKDEHSKKAYKHLATLHQDCSDIVRMVMETGAIQREIRDLQEQVETESSKKVGDNLERISADMRLLKEENVTLTRQLKL